MVLFGESKQAMKQKFGTALFLSLLVLAPIRAAQAYIYIHNDAEYSIDLPEPPKAETIWADRDEAIPYLDNPPKYGFVGEHAWFKRADADTGDSFSVDITFLKADRDYLLSLNKEKMLGQMKDIYKDISLDNEEEHFSQGTDTLKWATVTGFSVDKANSLHYNAAHFLSGLDTIMVIKVDYNVENQTFQKYYDALAKSIKYAGK
jgi:hypothetical protein